MVYTCFDLSLCCDTDYMDAKRTVCIFITTICMQLVHDFYITEFAKQCFAFLFSF